MSGKALRHALAALAVLVSLRHDVASAAGDAASAVGKDVVVHVGDWTMTSPEITAEFAYSPPALINQIKRSDNAARLLAVEWYSNALIAKAAADDKLLDQLPGLKDAADALRRKMIAGSAVQQYLKNKYAPDERELKQFVEMNEGVCQAPGRYHVALIGVIVGKKASEPEAQGAKNRIEDIKKRLAAGESFATLADERSDLPMKGAGGEAGWLSAEEVEHTDGKEQLTRLRKGEVSDVTKTADGFVIFKLLDREEPRKLSFEECRATAEKVMNARYRAQVARDWIDELAKRYDASINMDAFAAAVRAVPLDKDWLEKQAAKIDGEAAAP